MEGNPNSFTINLTNPQLVQIKGSTMTFQNGNTYNLNDPDLSYFITITQIDTEIQNENLIHSFLNNMKYDINYADKKSKTYYIIKDLFNQYKYREIPYREYQLGSGLNQNTLGTSSSKSLICVFLPSDPDELVDQPKLIALEKVCGNDNPMINKQIIAIADKLLEYECITTNQHQNIQSAFDSYEAPSAWNMNLFKKDLFVDLRSCNLD